MMKALKLNLALFAILFIALWSSYNKEKEVISLEAQKYPQIEIPAPPKKPKIMVKAGIPAEDYKCTQ